tara:strand:- start:10754 stop:10933 length:180 start_codon:yes stop_codon:yes gene_type:complete
MVSTGFNKSGVDVLGIHWAQYLSMTCVSLLIFLVALDKAVPTFHKFILGFLAKAGIICF